MTGRFVIVCALLLSAAAAVAETAPTPSAADPQSQRRLLEQKAALVERLLSESPAAKRIGASSNADAKQHMAAAREQYAAVGALLQSGDLAGADARLNEAMWLIGKARQLVPDSMYRLTEHRVRYARLLESIESLRGSYEHHMGRAKGASADKEKANLARVSSMVEEAKSLATSEQVVEANKVLASAEQSLMAGLNRLLGTETLQYTPKFNTPNEELDYEMERNRSLVELVPVAVAQLNPPKEAVQLIDRYVSSNESLRGQAKQHASKRDYRSALQSVREGTAFLQRALLAAGLVVPQE